MSKKRKLLLLYLAELILLTFWKNDCIKTLAYEHSSSGLEHLENAKHFVIQEKFDLAKTELLAGLKSDPKSPDILNNLGAIYLQLSQNATNQYTKVDNLNAARMYFTKAVDNDPDFSPAWNGLANSYYLGGRPRQAIPCYKKALSLSPKHIYEPLTSLANALRDVGLTQEAKESYQKAIELNPVYAPAHSGYAELLFSQHNFDEAYDEAVEAIRLKPSYSNAYYHLGLIEEARANKLDALKAYLLSLRYEKDSKYAQDTQHLIDKLGLDSNSISFQDLKQYQNKLIKSLVLTVPQPKITENSSVQNSASRSQTQTFNLSTTNLQINIAAIQQLIASKEWRKANISLTSLLKQHTGEPVLLNELGLVLFSQKKYSQAEKILKEAISRSGDSLGSAYYNIGQVYIARHKLTQAHQALSKAKQLCSHSGSELALINNALAITCKQQGNFNEALSLYNEAAKQSHTDYPVIHYNLALLLENMGKKQQAAEEFQTYLHWAPHGLNAKNAQLHLKRLL